VPTTRFAPSPTGPLHLGHAYSAVLAHAASGPGGAFHLRIDDIDQGRSRAEWRAAIDDDLVWLGLSVDGPAVVQSERTPLYPAAREQLREAGLLYPCFCSRADIAAEIAASASAQHGADGRVYPGICRGRDASETADRLAAGDAAAWRLDIRKAMARTGKLGWHDVARGHVIAHPQMSGDVVLWRRASGTDEAGPAYHLASTVDDASMCVDLVVRGQDLLGATDIHRLLQALLDLPTPRYHHHRLVAGADGRRLAKRDDAASLAGMRAAGVDGALLAEMLRGNALPLPYRWVDT
jgi:glutamyl-Q tRNA(Asp) synthetase